MKIIKKIRTDAGLTLQQVSEATGLSVGLINGFELGTMTNPKFKTVEALANFFHGDRDQIHKAGERIPRDIFYRLVNSPKSFAYIREALDDAGI